MKERYPIEQLARMSDEEMIQRQFDLRNLRLLTALLIGVALFRLFGTIIGAAEGQVDAARIVSTLVNVAVNFILVLPLRRVRRKWTARWPVSAWVLWFCAAQYLWFHIPPTQPIWTIGGLYALVMSRFRLARTRVLLLHLFYFVTTALAAWIIPVNKAVDTILSLVVVTLMIVAAMFLQLRSTRKARIAILDEWREPLQNARDQVRMRDELRYAREMQLAMLPDRAPQLDWLDLAGVSIPAAEVGGDYYDFFPAEDRVAIVACDVAGHGMASGLVLAAMRGGFTILRHSMTSPAAVLEQLHDLVKHSSRQRMLATACVVVIDRTTRKATISSAGHPPLVIRRDSSAQRIELFAPPLGVRLPISIREQTCDLAAGDVLVLHSDGIYESRNESGEIYGLERLEQTIAAQPHDATAEALRDAIVRDVESFRGSAAQEDDVTVVVARFRGDA